MIRLLKTAGAAFWVRAVGWGLLFGMAIGIPTVLVDSPLFSRMTPATWWSYVTWITVSLLGGLVMALRKMVRMCSVEGSATAGGGLAYLAVGCPICNKVVVAMVGTSGALSFFAPLQPVLAAMSLIILGVAVRRQVKLATRGSTRLSAPDGLGFAPRRPIGSKVLGARGD